MLARTDILIHLHVSPDTPSVTKKKQSEMPKIKILRRKSFRLVGDVLSHHNNVKLGATSLKLYGYINYLNKIRISGHWNSTDLSYKKNINEECREYFYSLSSGYEATITVVSI